MVLGVEGQFWEGQTSFSPRAGSPHSQATLIYATAITDALTGLRPVSRKGIERCNVPPSRPRRPQCRLAPKCELSVGKQYLTAEGG
ncbi:hypothetical protein TNIN_16841 [Trichonephila inaurata madagascariensis]|uniref:Uncharacterized protein n=1 Tax=Trichonephila inaurata madagascariensis TaxID=2747483 RepID=A0A8X6Y3S6_9ARAC|nr:hypothetical protein TNIN_16841 [Trichonephila inaurata madagascariensis]